LKCLALSSLSLTVCSCCVACVSVATNVQVIFIALYPLLQTLQCS
jgi:hypothetical protein